MRALLVLTLAACTEHVQLGGGSLPGLQEIVVALAARGCHVLLSNSTADEITALYAENADARAAGLRAMRVPARRAVNSNAARRGAVDEYLITNVGPAPAPAPS